MSATLASNGEKHGAISITPRSWVAASWLPTIAFVVPLAFAAIAFARVGHWPYYSHPDPKDLGLPILHSAALLCYPLALLSILARVSARVIWSQGFRKGELVVFLIGTALWTLGLVILVPLFGWLAD